MDQHGDVGMVSASRSSLESSCRMIPAAPGRAALASILCFPRITAVRRSARRNQMSRLRAALRFFWCSLAARRLATVFTPQRRLGNAELAAVGLGFERSLVSAVTCFWPDI